MTDHRGLYVAQGTGGAGTTPIGARLAAAGLIAHNGAGASDVRLGVLADGGGAVVSGTASSPTLTYSIRAAVFVTRTSAGNGPVIAARDAAATVTTDPVPGTNSRWDLIWVRHTHVSGDGGSASTPELEFGVTSGTAGSSPSKPTGSLPTGALVLAEARVYSTYTSTADATVTNTHPWTVAAGAPIPVRDATDLATLTPYTGMLIDRLDLGVTRRWSGTDWRAVNAIESRSLVKTAAQTLGTTSATKITGWSNAGANVDTGDLFTLSGDTLTCVRAGRYEIEARAVVGMTGAAASFDWNVRLNGSNSFADTAPYTGTSAWFRVNAKRRLVLAVGDTLEVYGQQNSTSAEIKASNMSATWDATWLGPA